MRHHTRTFLFVLAAAILFPNFVFSKDLQAPPQIEIPTFQWTNSHPVKHWLETFLPNGKVPIYETKTNELVFIPKNDQKTLIQGSLPVFIISKNFSFNKSEIEPSIKKWLSTGVAQGAVELSIVPIAAPGEKESASLLKRNLIFLSNLMAGKVPPRFFTLWSFNPISKQEDFKASIDHAVPWLELSSNPRNQDPLLNETCHYLSKWLKTIQILAGKETNLSHKAFFECLFKLKKAENASDLKENIFSEIKITRLSLPLFDKDKYRFEIETELDTQSVTALAKLRKKETEP